MHPHSPTIRPQVGRQSGSRDTLPRPLFLSHADLNPRPPRPASKPSKYTVHEGMDLAHNSAPASTWLPQPFACLGAGPGNGAQPCQGAKTLCSQETSQPGKEVQAKPSTQKARALPSTLLPGFKETSDSSTTHEAPVNVLMTVTMLLGQATEEAIRRGTQTGL